MPITLVTGTPGCGKTALVVSMILEEARKGRPVWCNGIPDLDAPHELLEHPRRWHEEGVVPDGSLIVLDEVQTHWRQAAPGSRIPDDIAALETHRHRGLDFIIITQGPRLVHSNVRALVGRHIHLRNVGVLGRWWYEWPEVGDTDSFKSAPIKRRYKLPAEVFARYKSATVHIKPARPIPPALIAAVGALLVLAALVVYIYRSFSSRLSPEATPAPAPAASAPARVMAGQGGVTSQVVFKAGQGWRPSTREPYDGLGVHLVGSVGEVLMFAVTLPHAGGRVAQFLSSAQLLRAGYTIRVDAPCSVTLWHGEHERRVTCDQPQLAAARSNAAAAPAGPASVPSGAKLQAASL